MKVVAAVVGFLFLTIAVFNQAQAESVISDPPEAPILIRFSHVVSENTAKGVGAELFKKRVEERLPGKVRVEVYPRSRKFTDNEVVMALLFGDVEMAAPSFAKLTQFGEDLRVFELPFLFPDVESVRRFQESQEGRKLLRSMLPIGIHGLAYWDNGMRVISATRPLRHPSDAKGLSFRIEPSAMLHKQYSQLGVVPRPMPFSQLTDAIRDGLVSGQENTWSNIYSRGVHRFHKHFTELDHSYLGYMVITNQAFWEGLPADIRVALDEIIVEVSKEVNEVAAKQAVEYRRKVAEADNTEIIRPTPQDAQEWQDAMCQVWKQFAPDIEADVLAAAMDAGATSLVTAAGDANPIGGLAVASYDSGVSNDVSPCFR
jgi:C4-dicarboxylate-binding protein DctP